jgi:oxygen-dependent protoporphyrinogen oxidase
MRVAVVGAGLAGLSAAGRLKSKGLDPVVFEAAAQAGGRAGSERLGPFVVDRGAYTVPEFHRAFIGLVREAGLARDLEATPGTSSVFFKGREHRLKFGSVRDLSAFRLLSLRGAADLARLLVRARFAHRASARSPSQAASLERETAAAFLRRSYGEELLEKVAYPMVSELFLGEPEGLSAATFLSMLRMPLRFRIYALRHGTGSVIDALCRELDVRLRTPVTRVTGDPARGPFRVETGGRPPSSFSFDRVVLAVPPPLVPALVPACPEPIARSLSAVRYSTSLVVALGLDRRPAAGSMINALLRREFPTVATVVLDHLKGPARVPEGRGLITAILTEPASTELFGAPEERIVRTVCDEIAGLWPEARTGLSFSRVFRWRYGGVQRPPGSLAESREMRQSLERWSSRLVVAGDGLFQASLETAVKTGHRAAERVAGSD